MPIWPSLGAERRLALTAVKVPHREDVQAEVLAGMTVAACGDSLLTGTCRRHLRALGAAEVPLGADEGTQAGSRVRLRGGAASPESAGPDAECVVSSPSGAGAEPLDEVAVQALCGLMEVHGRQLGRPRALGLEIATVSASILSIQGLLACLLAQLRGGGARRVDTSVEQAALFFLTHYFAAATCGDGWEAPGQDGEPGPPFLTADGQWFELEALDPDSWNRFWRELGLHGPEVGRSWMSFVFRYVTATSRLHRSLLLATRQRRMQEIRSAAAAAGVSVCRLRGYPEVVEALRCVEPAGHRVTVPAPWAIVSGGVRAGQRSEGPLWAPGRDRLPLAGLRVVEVTRRIQGPMAGLVLRMLGADVVRVEPPGGDPMRMMPPLAGGSSARFMAMNRGKEVREIDIKDPASRPALLELIAGADVFLENWMPGKDRAMMLDFEHLTRVAPRLVYGAISGWGPETPPGSPVGTDFLVQAHAGLGDVLNPPGEAPFPSLLTVTDVLGALVAAEGVLAALVRRERTGLGARVETSLYSAAMELQAHVLERCVTGAEEVLAGRIPAGAPRFPVLTDLAALPADPRFAPFFERAGGCWLPGRPWRFSE
jgi:crotonobetainyl-CoA:carnitine CoA-transferase CaiB-like acyl-CoA transferase